MVEGVLGTCEGAIPRSILFVLTLGRVMHSTTHLSALTAHDVPPVRDVQDGAGGDAANGGLGNDTSTADAGDTTTSC